MAKGVSLDLKKKKKKKTDLIIKKGWDSDP